MRQASFMQLWRTYLSRHFNTWTDIHGLCQLPSCFSYTNSPRQLLSLPHLFALDSGSKAWIAGAVVGSVAGTALILLGIIFFLRHKKLYTKVHQKTKAMATR